MSNKIEKGKSQLSWEDRLSSIVPRSSVENIEIPGDNIIKVDRVKHEKYGRGWHVQVAGDNEAAIGYLLADKMGLRLIELGEEDFFPGLSENFADKVRGDSSSGKLYVEFTPEERITEAENIVEYVEQEIENQKIQILVRNEVLDYKKDDSLTRFFQAIAQEPNIVGVGISRIKLGGIYTHVFIKNFDGLSEGEYSRISEVLENGFDLLEEVSKTTAGAHSFISVSDDEDLETLASEYKEKYYTPLTEEDIENDPFALIGLKGACEQMDLAGIVMFRDEEAIQASP